MTVTAAPEAPISTTTAEVVLVAHMHVRRAVTELLTLAKTDPPSQAAVLHTLRELDSELLEATLAVFRDRNAAAAGS